MVQPLSLLRGGGFVKHIEGGEVLSAKGLFAYRNPKGLRALAIKFSKSLPEWLSTVPWEELRLYLEQNTKCLESVVLGDGSSAEDRKRGGGGGADGGAADVDVANAEVDPSAVAAMKGLFASLVTAHQFVVEAAPFEIDGQFLMNLTRMTSDLRLYDLRMQWNVELLTGIKGHFGSLKRLGFPAGCINIPALVSTVEGMLL